MERFKTWTVEKLLRAFLCYFLNETKVASDGFFESEDGEIAADPDMWASFTVHNGGDENIELYGGGKILTPGESLSFGPYFNRAKRMDRISFKFDPADPNKRLEVVYDQYRK